MGIGLLEASPVLLLFLLGYCLAVIDGELRCYCNESGCVATGYMCKSAVGRCFTSIEGPGLGDDDGHRQTTHGCLDSLPPRHRVACKSAGVDMVSATDAGSGTYILQRLPLLVCCSEHMCNYIEDEGVGNVVLSHPTQNNGTFLRGNTFFKTDKAVSTRNHGSNRDHDRDLWFKAAVIAVPIAGGFILVLLVLLAVRMLKTDSRHHRRLIQIRQERNFTKSHMYISDQYVSKKHQCSLFNEKTGKICSILYPTETPRPCTGEKSPVNPIFPSHHHKNPSHRTGYTGLFGSNKYYNKRRKLKNTRLAVSDKPSTLVQHSCDNLSYSNSCSKHIDNGCCKEHCGGGCSFSSSDKHVPVSEAESLSSKEIFKDNGESTNIQQNEHSEKIENKTQHEVLSNVTSREGTIWDRPSADMICGQ